MRSLIGSFVVCRSQSVQRWLDVCALRSALHGVTALRERRCGYVKQTHWLRTGRIGASYLRGSFEIQGAKRGRVSRNLIISKYAAFHAARAITDRRVGAVRRVTLKGNNERRELFSLAREGS